MQRKRSSWTIVLEAAVTFMLVGCGHERPAPGAASAQGSNALQPSPAQVSADTLHLFVTTSPSTLNPLLAPTTVEQNLALLVYDTLVAPDAANVLQPDLVTVVPTVANGGISRDGKTVTIKLRRDVRWQDGARLTSADVAFTFAKINDPRVNVSTRTGYDRILRVQTPDPYTVRITLREPFAPFINDVGYPYPIVPKHLLESAPNFNVNSSNTHPVGSGPYRFVRWQRGNRIEYLANESYFRGAPKIKHLSIAELTDENSIALQLRTHQLDMGYVESSAYAQLRTVPGLRSSVEPTNGFLAYALNTTSPILSDERVRRAFSMAIDRATIAAKTTFDTGIPAYADLPAMMWTAHAPQNPYGYNLPAARAMLDAAGWKVGADGIRVKHGVSLRLRGVDASGSSSQANIDAQVQQALRSIGIDWSTKYFSSTLYYGSAADGGPLYGGKYDTALISWQAGIDTENDSLYTCANRGTIANTALYCSSEMDRLQRDSLTTLDPARHAADVSRIEQLAVTDVPYVFLYYPPWRYVWNAALRRTRSNLLYPWYGIETWTLDRQQAN